MNNQIKILIADDFPTMRKILKSILSDLGYSHIDEVENGTQALRALESNHFDLLISDWHMPEMTGLDLVKKLRTHDRLSDMPVLMLTTEAKKENIVRAARAGVNGYILKPFNAQKIKENIEKIFT